MDKKEYYYNYFNLLLFLGILTLPYTTLPMNMTLVYAIPLLIIYGLTGSYNMFYLVFRNNPNTRDNPEIAAILHILIFISGTIIAYMVGSYLAVHIFSFPIGVIGSIFKLASRRNPVKHK